MYYFFFVQLYFIPLSSKLQFTFLFTFIYSSIVNKDQLRSCVELHVGSPLSKVSKLLAYFNMIYYYVAKVLFNVSIIFYNTDLHLLKVRNNILNIKMSN